MENALYRITIITTNKTGKRTSKKEEQRARRFIIQLRHIRALKCLKQETMVVTIQIECLTVQRIRSAIKVKQARNAAITRHNILSTIYEANRIRTILK